jgi:hypothetical protein
MPDAEQTALELIEDQLTQYVGVQRRYRNSGYTFAEALKLHRRQALDNYAADEDEIWFKRNGLLEKLADRKGVSLVGEPQVSDVLAEIRQRQPSRDKAQAEYVQRMEQVAGTIGITDV